MKVRISFFFISDSVTRDIYTSNSALLTVCVADGNCGRSDRGEPAEIFLRVKIRIERSLVSAMTLICFVAT